MSNEEERRTILVVDDDELIARTLQRFLQGEGYTVITAADSTEALKAIEEKKPDVVLLDILMPRMNGLEIIKELQKRGVGRITRRIIVMSAYSDMEDRVLKLPVAGFLVKPFVYLDFILEEIQRVLREQGRRF